MSHWGSISGVGPCGQFYVLAGGSLLPRTLALALPTRKVLVSDPKLQWITFGQGNDSRVITRQSSLPSFRGLAEKPAEAALGRMDWVRKLLDLQRPDAAESLANAK